MSYNNSRALGRGQNRGFSGRGGGGRNGGCRGAHQPAPSINNGLKETGNGQGGKSKLNPASLVPETSVTSATAAPIPAQNGGRAQPTSQEGTKIVALQFGTISPGVINGLKIPAHTSSVPPNLDEQKQDQARQAAPRAAPTQPIPPNTLQKPQQQALQRNDLRAINPPSLQACPKITTAPCQAAPRAAPTQPIPPTTLQKQQQQQQEFQINDPRPTNQPSLPVHPKITTAPPVIRPSVAPPPCSSNQGISIPMGFQQPPFPIQFGNPGPHHISTLNGPYPQQFFLHNLPTHPTQPPVMHQSFQMAPQPVTFGAVPPPQFLRQPLPINFMSSPRSSPVKITNPKTHEELRLDSRTDNNNSNANASHAQFQQHQQPIFHKSNGVTVNTGQNNQVGQVGQSRQPISCMGPVGSVQGLMKSNGVQVDLKSVAPTMLPVFLTKESKSRGSVASVLTPRDVPIASGMSIQTVVENNPKKTEQANESTSAASTRDEFPQKNKLTTKNDLPSSNGVKNVKALGSIRSSSSVTESSKNRSEDSDSDSISIVSMNGDGRINSLSKPGLEKSEVSKYSVDGRVHPLPTTSESSQNAKPPALSKQEEKEMNSSENKINSNDLKSERKMIINHNVHPATSGTKDSDVLETNKAKARTGKKKKGRDLLSKADAPGNSDLYNAYKIKEKPQVINTSESTDVLPKENTDDSKNILATPIEKEIKAEDNNWEDAADVTVSDNVLMTEAKYTKKYTRDFLLNFSEHCTDLPISFVMGSDITNLLSTGSHAINPSHRRSSGGSHGDRRGNDMFGDDKWNKAANSFPLKDIRNDPNHGVSRYTRGQPVNQYYPSPNNLMPQMMSPHGTFMHNNSENDRWHSLNNSRGLIPPPLTPLQAMHRAENKYVVGKISDEEQAKQRQLKGILNKLTPQNFEKLFQQVKDVNIDNTVTLSGVISQIFDKALMEPTFCEMYADFCYHLSDALPYFTENDEKITFKRLLLNKCQEEFERGEREQAEANRDEEDGEAKQTEEEREERRIKARRRMLGNIRLVGEIYKKRMLTERIIHECIQKLLGEYDNPDEENLESLCKLMATVGDQIDNNPKAREFMNSYFDAIVKLSNNQKLTSRLRFMLRDVVDLRNNRWQQRIKVDGPKKIEDVHRDAAQEKISQTNRLNRAPSMNSNQRRGPPGDYNSRTSSVLPSPSSHPSSIRGFPNQLHGYAAQDARIYERHPFENRALSFPSTQRSVNDNLTTLGPQGGLARVVSFRQPSTNGNTSMTGVTNNQSRKDSTWRSLPNKEQKLQGQNTTAGALPNGQSQGPTMGKPLPEEVLKEKSMATIREFYSVKDEAEVALCIRELNSLGFYPSIVSLWVTDSFERKDAERELLAKLLVNLCKAHDHVLNQMQLIQGFESVLSMLEDTVTDAPRAAEFLGGIFVKIILENVIPLRDIGRIIHEGGEEPGRLLEVGLASEVLGSILEIIKEERGDEIFKEMIADSSLHLEEFKAPDSLKSKKLDAFL